MMELKLPAPCLLVLIGPSGAGKTTWAAGSFEASQVVSSDALRALVGIDEDDQAAGTVAFELLDRIVEERLRRNLTTVIDTTGLNPDNRRRWVERGHAAGIAVHAVVFDAPESVCEERNRAKTRPIPKTVLSKQFAAMRRSVEHIEHEGFDGIHHQQPIAVVPPQVAETARPSVNPPAAGHTFGLILSRFDWPGDDLGTQVADIAKRAETAGFRDIWLMDHLRQIRGVGRPWEDLLEVYTTLGYVAATTSMIRLGAMVTGVTHRNPAVLGKMLATLDVLSGGRMICGLGAAWDESEHNAYGIEFPDLSTRYDLLQDTLEMLPLLWGKGSPSYEGRVFSAAKLVCYPRPIQERVPILVGGGGERRTLRLVARYADAANVFGEPGGVAHKTEVLHRHCADLQRDPGDIEITHLTTAMVGTDRKALADRIDSLRGRNTTREDYARRHNAGTVDDLIPLFGAYHEAGASHSVVALPDVALPGSIETFGEIIAALRQP